MLCLEGPSVIQWSYQRSQVSPRSQKGQLIGLDKKLDFEAYEYPVRLL